MQIEIDIILNNMFKKWIVMAVGILIGVGLAPVTIELIELLGFSLYDRSSLDLFLKQEFKDSDMNGINAIDLLIPSYSFNAK